MENEVPTKELKKLFESRWMMLCAAFGAVLLGTMVLGQFFDFVKLLNPVLAPFLIGATIAYFGDPWADKLEAHPKISRTTAVVIVFSCLVLLFLLVVLLVVPAIHEQVVALLKRLPSDLERLRTQGIPVFGLEPEHFQRFLDIASWKEWIASKGAEVASTTAPTVAKVSGIIAETVTRSGAAVIAFALNLLIIPVVAFYLLRDWDHLTERVAGLLPKRWEVQTLKLAEEVDDVLGSFVRGQLSVMLGLALLYTFGLWLAGIEGAVIIGMLAGAVSFVPYMGLIIGMGGAIIAALIQYHDFWHVIYVMLVFGGVQAIEGMALTPLLVGDRIGLHPVAVIFAVLLGEHLFGVTGMILALPVAAISVVLLKKAQTRYLNSSFYN